jgi:hypothetical protein
VYMGIFFCHSISAMVDFPLAQADAASNLEITFILSLIFKINVYVIIIPVMSFTISWHVSIYERANTHTQTCVHCHVLVIRHYK